MDVPYPYHPCAAHQSGKMQEVPEDYADSHLRASLYFSHDTLRYAAYLPFSLRRAPEAVNFIDSASAFRTIYISSSIWQDAGWGTIIYLATLSSVDASLHEAAKVDGASTWQRILHIDIPELIPIIVIQLIMQFGNLMNVGFEKAFLLQTNLNKETSEIIATYVYEQGMLKAMYSFSTAVGLFNTAVNIILLIVVNKICKKVSDISFI